MFDSKKLILLITSLLYLTSCQKNPESKFEQDGISMTIPLGWEISEEENIGDQGYYLSIQKQGFNSSAMIAMNWVKGEISYDSWVEIYQEILESNIIYRNANLELGELKDTSFNNIESKYVKVDFSLLGLKHQAIIYFIRQNGKSITIMKQEALEDMDENRKGFKKIESSFKVKS